MIKTMPSKFIRIFKFSLVFAVFLTEIFLFDRYALAVDTTPPTTTYVQTPSSPDGKNNWYVTPVRLDLTATDLESGVKEINYRINEGIWQKVSFSDSLNLVQNPSFETTGGTTSGLASWDSTLIDSNITYSQDTTQYVSGYETASAKIVSTIGSGIWQGINNRNYFAVAGSFENMTASEWIKTSGVGESAFFKVYAITQDQYGTQTNVLMGQSSTISGTVGWTKLSLDFNTNVSNVIGVYMDIGFTGTGTIWADAVTISSAALPTTTTFTDGTDSENSKVEFYSVDFAENIETYSCTTPVKNCINFKLDQTPPGGWYDAGAIRSLQGSDHELYVYTNVIDPVSGISNLSDKYQYMTDKNPGSFGSFASLLNCNSSWQPGTWVALESPPFSPGDNDVYLRTQKTEFCNNDWKTCKAVRFYAEDMAGNTDEKDYCINGPWISVLGEGGVRSNQNINMLAEAVDDNTDGLIEASGNIVNFFSSSRDWLVKNSSAPATINYDDFDNTLKNKTTITDGKLRKTSGVYKINSNFTINNQSLPVGFSSSVFNQIVLVNGDLTIDTEISIDPSSTLLFVVSGDVGIIKNVDLIESAIMADGDINTAYNVTEGDANNTLDMKGIFSANKFIFKRTLQGTNNANFPSETFTYEPKYLIQLRDLYGVYTVKWLGTN